MAEPKVNLTTQTLATGSIPFFGQNFTGVGLINGISLSAIESELGTKLPKSGGTMSGSVDMGGNNFTTVGLLNGINPANIVVIADLIFTNLSDVPSSYAVGDALKLLRVNAAHDGLEFVDPVAALSPSGTATITAPDNGVVTVSLPYAQGDTNYRIIATGDASGGWSVPVKTVNSFEIHASSSAWVGDVDWMLVRNGDTGDPDRDGTATIVSGGVVAVTFGTPYADANYKAFATPSMTVGYSVKNKLSTGFEIHLSSSIVTGDVDWFTIYG